MKHFSAAILTLTFTAFALPAQAQLVVLGNGDSAACYNYAMSGNTGSHKALDTCSQGLKQDISRRDEAATYVNRGVLYMRKGDQVRATADYERALEIQPKLTQAHINHAASLIRQAKFDAALVSLDTALEDTDAATRPEALYNRAIVMDSKMDYRSAYSNLKEALAIRPDWKPALDLISRYEVRPSG